MLLDGPREPFWETADLNDPRPHQRHPLRDLAFETDVFSYFMVGDQWSWEPRAHHWEIVGEPWYGRT